MDWFRISYLNQSALLLVIGTTFHCHAPLGDGGSKTSDILPFIEGDVEPKIGEGYDSLTQELRNSPDCVVGTPMKLSSSRSTINLNQNVDGQGMLREFTSEVEGTSRLVFLQGGVGAGFFRSLTQKKSVLSLIYAVKIETGGEKLTNVILGSEIKDLPSLQLLKQCGDSYVMQINRGGLLAITLNFEFNSEESKAKWQGKLKVGGGLGELSNELTKKVQQDDIDGALTIHVNQRGGALHQSLLGVKTCSLSTPKDYEECKAMMDQIIAYATEKFPIEVQNQPAILNYVTASLYSLGAPQMPSLDKSVIQARKILAEFQETNNTQVAMMEKARTIGLSFEQPLAQAIMDNKSMIKSAAAKCFKYSISEKGIDWRQCMSEFDRIKKNLIAINPEAATVNELNIRSNSQIGNSIVNQYSRNINIAYKMAAKRTVDRRCVNPKNTSGLVNPQEKAGTLLVRTENSTQNIDHSATAEIYPGEALGFVFNYTTEDFRNSHGSQTLYWRCTNCTLSHVKVPTYRILVKSHEELGTLFRSQDPRSTDFHFVAYGRWRSSPRAAWSDALGGKDSCSPNCPVPSAPKQTLVLKSSNGSKAIGKEGCITAIKNSPITFVMNDERGAYSDNQGELEIILQARSCGVHSHPISLSPSATE
jgi:hypothetical protein